MKKSFFKSVIKNGTLGYVYQKLIYSQENVLQDLVFLDANGIFEKIVNLSLKKMVKRKASTLGDEARYYLETLKETFLEARVAGNRQNLKYFPTTKEALQPFCTTFQTGLLVTIFVEIENITIPCWMRAALQDDGQQHERLPVDPGYGSEVLLHQSFLPEGLRIFSGRNDDPFPEGFPDHGVLRKGIKNLRQFLRFRESRSSEGPGRDH